MNTRMVSQDFKNGQDFSKEHKYNLPEVSLHWHNCYELDIVLSGTGQTICNGQSFPVKRRLVSFLSPMDLHEYRECHDLEMINIKFTETNINDELLQHFTNIKSNVVYMDQKTFSIMLSLCELLDSLNSDKFSKNYNSRLIECLIITFLKCCISEANHSLDSELIQKVVIYLNAHFRENPKMCDIAQMFHLSDSYFCRLFKKCVGMSYKEYIKKLKLEYGYKLIQNTDLSMTDIAFNCGYDTQSHFNREFKNYFGAAPSFFR